MKKPDRIKIVFILPSLSAGGAERVMLTLLSNINRTLFEPLLIVGDLKGEFSEFVPDDIKLINLKSGRVRTLVIKLVPTIHRIKPDIVFSTLGYLNVLIMLFRPLLPGRTTFIGRETNIPSMHLPQSRYPLILKVLYQWVYPKFDNIVCQSIEMLKDMQVNFRISKKKLTLINNPIDFKSISRKKDTTVPLLFSSGFNLVAAGKLMHQKGFDMLFKALAKTRNKNICLTLLGEGPLRTELEYLCDRLGIRERVCFKGFSSNPYKYMAAADLFVLSSRYEGFPNVVLEAMACGTPVLAFNCPGGLVQLIENNKNGWLVPPGDIDQFAQKMDEAVGRGLDRDEIINRTCKQFSAEKITQSYQDLFVSCLSNKNT